MTWRRRGAFTVFRQLWQGPLPSTPSSISKEVRMELILYYAPNACSLVPYVTLTEANAPFEVRPLNFRKSQHMSPEYLRLNPKHKVPVLVIDGAPLTENVAIQIWIARHFPE